MMKEHLEFFAIDLSSGWEPPSGYPEGVEQKILAGYLDEAKNKGSRTCLLEFPKENTASGGVLLSDKK